MAEHFKYYPSDENVVTPWNARYSYPSQANKAVKMTPRIPPKNGSSFTPGQICRLEFPAQGYVNPLNTHLEMDVVLYGPIVSSGSFAVRFQNNIQSIFNRVRLLYGGNPLEDMLQYGVVVRCLTEWTAGSQTSAVDRSTITDGIGGVLANTSLGISGSGSTTVTSASVSGTTVTFAGTGFPSVAVGGWVIIAGITGQTAGTYNGAYQVVTATGSTGFTVNNYTGVAGTVTGSPISGAGIYATTPVSANVNTRQAFIQGVAGTTTGTGNQYSGVVPNSTSTGNIPSGCPSPAAGQQFSVRRYMINFALGMFTQDKLIPTKYMASQLAIEITFEASAACIYQPMGFSNTSTFASYAVGNINLIPEIIEFDDTYDEMFMSGLESGGVPLKFSTWHYFQFGTQNSSSLQLQITERSRSVKGIFAVQRRSPSGFQYDSHACFYDTYLAQSYAAGSTMQSYQYRIGGR